VKGTDRNILIVLPLLAAIIGLYLLVIAPKRAESGDLQKKIDDLQAQAATVDTDAASAEQARRSFDRNYATLIELGAAAPPDDDQATLVYDLASMATDTGVHFSGFELSATAAGAVSPTAAAPAAPAAPAAAPAAPASGEATTTTTTSTAASAATPTAATTATPTEATAATLPLGATVGPAGFPTTAYTFNLTGTYFAATDFLAALNSGVEASPAGKPKVNGRLLTVNGFSFSLDQVDDYPQLTANFDITAYAVPADQGLDAGATPAGPAPVGSPAAATTAAPTTASVTP
jgi:hypothetical protein